MPKCRSTAAAACWTCSMVHPASTVMVNRAGSTEVIRFKREVDSSTDGR